MTLTPNDDTHLEPTETASFTLQPSASYDLGNASVTMTIADNDGVMMNFKPDTSTTPAGSVADTGLKFADRYRGSLAFRCHFAVPSASNPAAMAVCRSASTACGLCRALSSPALLPVNAARTTRRMTFMFFVRGRSSAKRIAWGRNDAPSGDGGLRGVVRMIEHPGDAERARHVLVVHQIHLAEIRAGRAITCRHEHELRCELKDRVRRDDVALMGHVFGWL